MTNILMNIQKLVPKIFKGLLMLLKLKDLLSLRMKLRLFLNKNKNFT